MINNSIDANFLSLLKDFSVWKESSSDPDAFTLMSYVQCITTPDSFFALAELFMPALVFHEGNYFREACFSVALYNEWKESLGDVVEVQKIMNHLHLRALFQENDTEDIVAIVAAKRLAAIWSAVFENKNLVGIASGNDIVTAAVTLIHKSQCSKM